MDLWCGGLHQVSKDGHEFQVPGPFMVLFCSICNFYFLNQKDDEECLFFWGGILVETLNDNFL